MKTQVSKSDFVSGFAPMGRADQFSYSALCALYEYYSDIEGYTLDVIEICCDFAEYTDLEDFQDGWGEEEYPDLNSVLDMGTVLELPGGGLVVENF